MNMLINVLIKTECAHTFRLFPTMKKPTPKKCSRVFYILRKQNIDLQGKERHTRTSSLLVCCPAQIWPHELFAYARQDYTDPT